MMVKSLFVFIASRLYFPVSFSLRRSQHTIIAILLLFFVSSLCSSAYCQLTRIRGKVMDAESMKPLPFVNISLQHTTVGTITDDEGEFFIETRVDADTLLVSFVGFEPQKRAIRKNQYQEIIVELNRDIYYLEEVVVLPGENPAHPILRKIIANKHRHNPSNFDSYYYESYNKVELGIDNVDEKLQNRRLLRDFQFMFEYVDTLTISGKAFLPLFISESMSNYYYRRSPSMEREIIKATRTSGIENVSLAEHAGVMFQQINIYDNYVRVFEPGFVSPIADFGLFYYNYYLLDSAYIDNKWCYHVSFVPRRRQDRTFRGDFWVNDTTFAIKRIQLRTAQEMNFNYINDFVAEYHYQQLDDSLFFLREEKFFFDFNIENRFRGFYVKKTTLYNDVVVNQGIPDQVADSRNRILVKENALKKDRDYWDQNRPLSLTGQEASIFDMVDSIQHVPVYKAYSRVVRMFLWDYYDIGYLELGPYFQTFSFNETEGSRFRLSARTSSDLSEKIMLNAHIAYGNKDKRFKYGGGAEYLFESNPRFSIYTDLKYDYEQLGQSRYALTDDNIFKSLLSRGPSYERTMVTQLELGVEREWFKGLTNIFSVSHRRIEGNEFVPLKKSNSRKDLDFGEVITTEFSLHTRFARNEKIVRSNHDRFSLGTTRPVFNLILTAGLSNVFESQYDYFKVAANVEQRLPLGPLGVFHYVIDGGWIFGSLPYPLLSLHPGNETYIFDRYAYNMMNYYEFASDRYLGVYIGQHFQGLLLNRIPLIQKLNFREVVSFKALIGRLDNAHNDVIAFPRGLHGLSDPYLEASAGIENIFKLFRLDAVWRLSYLDHENIDDFGVRITMHFSF